MNDLKQFKHGEESTHHACQEMTDKLGDKVGCCACNGHKCSLNVKKTMDGFSKEDMERITAQSSIDQMKAHEKRIIEVERERIEREKEPRK